MTKQSIRQRDFQEISNVLSTFTSLTQIKAILFTLNGILVANHFIYLNPESVKEALASQDLKAPIVLPVCLEKRVWGIIILEAVDIPSKRIMISKNYLESALNEISSEHFTGQFSILESLTPSQITQLNMLSIIYPSLTPLGSPSSNEHSQTQLPKVKSPSSPTNYSINIATDYIHNHLQSPLSLNEVARQVYLSPAYLSRLFKKHLHVNFIEYVNSQKIALAQEKLAMSQLTVREISSNLGYSQTSYFTKLFKRRTGQTPSEFRRQHHAVQKIYTIPRQSDSDNSKTVLDASQAYFQNNHIDYFTDSAHGVPYMHSIDDLDDTDGHKGWAYSVDGQFPLKSADQVTMTDKSVVQWVYTTYNQND